MKNVGIIGGGASGMMAAVAAAEEGARVTILEKQDRIGKKILATGNGKCNLSNLSFSAQRDYHSQEPEKIESFFKQFSVREAVAFFEDRGLVLTEKNGYLYPRSGQASTVLNLFLEQLERLSVKIVTECGIHRIQKEKNGYRVCTDKGDFSFDTLVLACGSNAGTKEKDGLGGTQLSEKLGIRSSQMLPALTALRCEGEYWKALAGVRCEGQITLQVKSRQGEEKVYRESGEIQLTDYGLSGIPAFQLSRHASLGLFGKAAVNASVDFFPDVKLGQWRVYCEQRVQKSAGRTVSAFLEGMVNKKIAQVLLKEAGLKMTDTVCVPMQKNLWKALCLMRDFKVHVKAVNPAANAQVCLGGVLLGQLDDHLQAKQCKGLYFAGELLDVDGRCGGYNLQWAWTSGWITGKNASR